jgi:hypothetical protein
MAFKLKGRNVKAEMQKIISKKPISHLKNIDLTRMT